MKHGAYSALLTCWFKDHGYSDREAFIYTLAAGLLWETARGWDHDSKGDMAANITGSLIVLIW
jgi:hypothetical protein